MKASTKVVGKAGRKGANVGYSGSLLGGLGGDLAGLKKITSARPSRPRSSRPPTSWCGQLSSIPWEGSVALVKGDKIYINRGTREGVAVDQQFAVGSVEEVVDQDTGEVLDRSLTQVGAVKVVEVKEKKLSICQATAGADRIQKGMIVQPAK